MTSRELRTDRTAETLSRALELVAADATHRPTPSQARAAATVALRHLHLGAHHPDARALLEALASGRLDATTDRARIVIGRCLLESLRELTALAIAVHTYGAAAIVDAFLASVLPAAPTELEALPELPDAPPAQSSPESTPRARRSVAPPHGPTLAAC